LTYGYLEQKTEEIAEFGERYKILIFMLRTLQSIWLGWFLNLFKFA
jgi:hypothetical protein